MFSRVYATIVALSLWITYVYFCQVIAKQDFSAPETYSLQLMVINALEKPKDFWKAILGEVEMKLSPMVFKALVGRTQAEVDTDNQSLKILCEDVFVRDNLEKKYYNVINEAILKLSGKQIKFHAVVNKSEKTTTPQTNEDTLGPLFQAPKDKDLVVREKQQKANLFPKFTFENYIMGKNNNLAYAVATAVAERPGELYNPVFIYSGVGLGKTHLLQAIGNQILNTKPGTKVVYTTGEDFTNELIDAIRGKGKYSTNDFRNKFRKADVFLIDDVQFVIGRESTQEEFFHTFNALYMNQKQIVITSDRPPKEFTNLEERVTSRFASGIIVDIQAPDFEMRTAILRTKRDTAHDPIPNNVIDFIADSVDSNVRELEGAYIQVLTDARAKGYEINLDSASAALGQSVRQKASPTVNVNQILKAVCTYYSVKMPDLKGKRRTKDLVLPRQVAMYLLKEMTSTPFMAIGDLLGGRDHTTIMHGVDKIGTEVKQRGKITQDISNVKQMVSAE